MQAKISYIILLSVASSALIGGYLLAPEQETQPTIKTPATKISVLSSKKLSAVITQHPDWQPTEAFDDFDKPPIDETNLQADVKVMLTTLKPNQPIRLTNINAIAHCASCVQLLKDALLSGKLSKKQLAQLANLLSRGNHPELATMLVETTEKLLQSGQTKRGELVINALARFNAAPVAQRFTDYLAHATDISRPLRDALINNINETTNRTQVAAAVVNQFNALSDVAGQQRLLAINQPEALAQLNAQAIAQGNSELSNQTVEQLQSNPSKYALDAVLTLKDSQSIDAAYTLANRQLSGNRLDYIENKLAQGGYSEQDKRLVLDVLSHSEDTARGAEIIAKFSD